MIEGSAVRVVMGSEGKDRPGTVFIGSLAVMDYGGVQVLGRWHRKDMKEDGHREVPVGASDTHTFFPWHSVDHIEIMESSGGKETEYAEAYRQGVQSLKAKDYAAAAVRFREALVLKPGDQKSQYYLEESERLSQAPS